MLADLRRPLQGELLGLNPQIGLTNGQVVPVRAGARVTGRANPAPPILCHSDAERGGGICDTTRPGSNHPR